MIDQFLNRIERLSNSLIVPVKADNPRANVKTVVLSHLSARADGTDDYTPWVAEVKKYFSGHVLVAKDLMEF